MALTVVHTSPSVVVLLPRLPGVNVGIHCRHQCHVEVVETTALAFLGSLIGPHSGGLPDTTIVSVMLSDSVKVDATMGVGRRMVGKRGEAAGSRSRVGRD